MHPLLLGLLLASSAHSGDIVSKGAIFTLQEDLLLAGDPTGKQYTYISYDGPEGEWCQLTLRGSYEDRIFRKGQTFTTGEHVTEFDLRIANSKSAIWITCSSFELNYVRNALKNVFLVTIPERTPVESRF